MSQKIENDSKVEQAKRVYYVENVQGKDFTFYLGIKGNEHLLPKEIVGKDRENQSRGERFSYSTKLNVVKIPLSLTKSHLKDDGNKLLDKLKEAAGQPESAWGKLFKALSGSLKVELEEKVENIEQNEEKKGSLLQKILAELNSLLTTGKIAEILGEPDEDLCEAERELINNSSKLEEQAYNNRKKVNKHFHEAIEPFISGRALICRSYRGDLLSVSFREKSSKSSYAPDEHVSREYPLSIKNYCDALYEAIFEFESKGFAKRGLLVIAGATNSSKSEIATGLIYKYLEEQKAAKRRPHLVTVEDPIEKFYELQGESKASKFSVEMPASKNGIDYTPREKGNAYEKDKDVESLKDALEDALRQTPTVLFVGETRDKGDWRRLVDFAGTGHLIVTTAHAGSLTEAMHKIFVALKVRTPAERSEIANRLLGIIHIKRHADTNILVPAIWRRTPTGKNALTAEGLSSLLPYRPEGYDAEKGCLGRAWFVKNLVKRLDEAKLPEEKKKLLEREAIKWDLEGV